MRGYTYEYRCGRWGMGDGDEMRGMFAWEHTQSNTVRRISTNNTTKIPTR